MTSIGIIFRESFNQETLFIPKFDPQRHRQRYPQPHTKRQRTFEHPRQRDQQHTGLTHQAREVYRALLALDPGNATLEAGLAALEVSRTTKVADTVPEVARSYAAAVTGGTNVKAFLADVLAARPYSLDSDSDSDSEPAGGGRPDDDLDAPTAMDTAFAEDEREDAQAAPARPADDGIPDRR